LAGSVKTEIKNRSAVHAEPLLLVNKKLAEICVDIGRLGHAGEQNGTLEIVYVLCGFFVVASY
jgi:hypothetical protein